MAKLVAIPGMQHPALAQIITNSIVTKPEKQSSLPLLCQRRPTTEGTQRSPGVPSRRASPETPSSMRGT